jgi:NDP-sugar pyrophosphorylase family protein
VTPPRAIILAAGLGTRLGALADERPKPLLPVCDVALIRYAVALLAGHGVTELAVNLHHRGELLRRELGDGRALGVEITYSEEPTILGTGGAFRKVGDFLTRGGRDSFLVVNGKILIDVDLTALVARHLAEDAAATLVLRETPDAARWGAIEVDEAGRVTRILDAGAPGARVCMFTGVHVIAPRLLERLPPEGASDSIRQAYLPALADGERLLGHLATGYFHEHSTPERYLEGNWNALSGKATLRYPPGPFTGVAESAAVSPSATLVAPYRIGDGAVVEAGAVVGPLAVVGARARVAEGARLSRVVAWPNARVAGALTDAIVTRSGATSVTSSVPGAPART